MLGRDFVSRITTLAVALTCCAGVAIGLTIWRLRVDAIEAAKQGAGDIAAVLAQRAGDSARNIDAVLQEVQARIASYGPSNEDEFAKLMTRRDMHDYLAARLATLPDIDAVNVVGNTGRLLGTTRHFPVPDIELSDREEFSHFADGPDPAMFIGAPDFGKVSGKWSMHFGRRVESATGEFLGVATISVQPSNFMRLYQAIAKIPGASSLLLRRDGVVYLRYPDAVERAGSRMPPQSGFYRAVSEGGGYFRSPGVFDAESRWVATRLLSNYPLVVNIAISETRALAVWRERATVIALGGALAAFVMAALLRLIYTGHRNTLESQALLTEREASLATTSRELQIANIRFDTALTHMRQGLAMYDDEDRIVIHNRGYAEMYSLPAGSMPPGTTHETVLEMRIAQGVYTMGGPDDYVRNHGRRVDEGGAEVQLLRDGRYILVTHEDMPDGGWLTTHEDVTESQRALAQISHMAHHDALTNLANRTLFLERIDSLGARGAPYAVLLLDLDRFKAVNDTHGHSAGDALLWAAASRMQAAAGSRGLVARLGGDEFAIALEIDEPDEASAALAVAEGALQRIRERFILDEQEVSIGVSIGVAVSNAASIPPRDIMRHADLAMYEAKNAGRDCCRLFEPRMEAESLSRRELASDLEAALTRGQLDVHYQPVVDAASLEARGMEALARWKHPTRGFVPPLEFIPVAEKAGLIGRLGEYILTRACRDAVAWPASVKVAVNVSSLQLSAGDLPDVVRRALRASGLPANRLELEITESVLLDRNAANIRQLLALRELGVGVVLDDFGTGYSSLSYLNSFPFDKIKIDKSFIDGLGTRAEASAIVLATISIAKSLNAVTTAEGVETLEQAELLRSAAVTEMQGYLLGKPRPASDWLFVDGKAVLAADVSGAALAA